MDGIIIDSEPVQMVAINQVLAQWNIQLTEAEYIPLVGRRLSDDFIQMKKTYSIPVEYPEFVQQKNATYQELIQHHAFEMPGLTELLQRLKSTGIKTAVASGSIRNDIELVLRCLDVTHYFDSITSGDEVTHGKPHPEIYLKAAERLNIPPAHCVAVEDTGYGIHASKDAGMKSIAIPHPYTRHQDFSRADKVLISLQLISLDLLNSL
jgi:HAD superfamily hydrolase (TIGR01509 family)